MKMGNLNSASSTTIAFEQNEQHSVFRFLGYDENIFFQPIWRSWQKIEPRLKFYSQNAVCIAAHKSLLLNMMPAIMSACYAVTANIKTIILPAKHLAALFIFERSG